MVVVDTSTPTGFHAHPFAGNCLANKGQYGKEEAGAQSAVHGDIPAASGAAGRGGRRRILRRRRGEMRQGLPAATKTPWRRYAGCPGHRAQASASGASDACIASKTKRPSRTALPVVTGEAGTLGLPRSEL